LFAVRHIQPQDGLEIALNRPKSSKSVFTIVEDTIFYIVDVDLIGDIGVLELEMIREELHCIASAHSGDLGAA
jgi:hypothetical protein